MEIKKLIALLLLIQGAAYGQRLSGIVTQNPIEDPAKTLHLLKTDPEQVIQGSAKQLYLTGLCYEYLNQEDSAVAYYLNSKKRFEAKKENDYAKEICLDIHRIISSQAHYSSYGTKFLDEFNLYAKEKKSPYLLALALNEYGKMHIDSFDYKKRSNPYVLKLADRDLRKALGYSIQSGEKWIISKVYSNLGVSKKAARELDSAIYFAQRSIAINESVDNKTELFINYFNLGNLFFTEKQYPQALKYFLIAEKIPLPKYKKKSLSKLYRKMTQTYDFLEDHKNRRKYQALYEGLHAEMSEETQNQLIADLQTKYETREKETKNKFLLKKNELLENKDRLSKTLLITATALIIVIIIVSLLYIKNISRKKKIAEQEKLIETQKLENTLKNQELHDIDLMLESQEKERHRIANELHDNLGSMLATLKLNFQNLKRKNDSPDLHSHQLFEKTDDLIEEAYQKVRNISHLKNLGVIGSEGLLAAVRKMAEKMSILEKLSINVIPFGLNERLENTVEITIFRMIQELCTNIIKHSQAGEVNIYLTQNNAESLNIMIEDNGKGFDPKAVRSKEGIGLSNIEKKTEQMGGAFTVDSGIGRGTTVIIDLPL